MSEPTFYAGAFGTALAAFAAGPLAEIFGQVGLLMAIMGALGGGARALAIKSSWRPGLRAALLGGLLAFGLGVISPPLLEKVLGLALTPDTSAVQMLAAGAFLVGFLQERILHFLGGDQ